MRLNKCWVSYNFLLFKEVSLELNHDIEHDIPKKIRRDSFFSNFAIFGKISSELLLENKE